MPVENRTASFKVASTIGGSVFLKSDKTQVLTPVKARYLAQQLVMAADRAESRFTETDLLVPFSQNGATQLCHQRLLYKQQYSIKFTDLDEFVSYMVSLAPNKARYLAQQLFMAADRSESSPTETDLLVPLARMVLLNSIIKDFCMNSSIQLSLLTWVILCLMSFLNSYRR